MQIRRWSAVTSVATVLAASLLGTATPAGAVGIGDFEIDITSMSGTPSMAKTPEEAKLPVGGCTKNGVPLVDPFTNGFSFGSGESVTCNSYMDQSLPKVSFSGTAKQVSSGLSGAFTLACTVRMVNENSFTISVNSIDDFSVKQDGYRSCTFELAVDGSKLTGTIEESISGTISKASSTTVTCPSDVEKMVQAMEGSAPPDIVCAKSNSRATAEVTGGTGIFAGQSGSGSYDSEQITPFVIPVKFVDSPGGGTGATPPSSGGGGSAELPAGATPTTCPVWYTGPGTCYSIPGSSDPLIVGDPNLQGLRIAQKSALGTSADLSLTLKKGGATPRTVIPAADTSGKRVLGAMPGSSAPAKFTFATAPGAKCTVTGKAKGKPIGLGSVKANAAGEAQTKVTAAVLKKKLKSKTGAVVTLATTCVSGKTKLPTSSTKVTLG